MREADQTIVGRAAELRSLEEELAGLERERRSRAVELAGEPGIGKTRLLAELGGRASRRGLLVLTGSASELEGDHPFSVFVDALDEYVYALEPRRLEALDDAVPEPEDGRDPRPQPVPQARRLVARRGRADDRARRSRRAHPG